MDISCCNKATLATCLGGTDLYCTLMEVVAEHPSSGRLRKYSGVLFQLTKTKTKVHFSKTFFIIVIKTKLLQHY